MSEEPDLAEVVFEEDGRRMVEAVLDDWDVFPPAIRRHGRLFRLVRTEIVSLSGRRTHTRVTYRCDARPTALKAATSARSEAT
jgi:hypothetical protein